MSTTSIPHQKKKKFAAAVAVENHHGNPHVTIGY